MVPGVRIEVTAIRIAGAITTDGGIGIATLEAAGEHTVEQPRLMESNWRPAQRSLGCTLLHRVEKELLKKEARVKQAREKRRAKRSSCQQIQSVIRAEG